MEGAESRMPVQWAVQHNDKPRHSYWGSTASSVCILGIAFDTSDQNGRMAGWSLGGGHHLSHKQTFVLIPSLSHTVWSVWSKYVLQAGVRTYATSWLVKTNRLVMYMLGYQVYI